jgi:hypothetical protein
MRLVSFMLVFFAGFAFGNIRACYNGGCIFHGRNYKVRPDSEAGKGAK